MTKLPPRIPPELSDLRRAVELLSAWARCVPRLSDGREARMREEVQALLEAVPSSKDEAWKWKIALRALAKEVAAEPDPEADP